MEQDKKRMNNDYDSIRIVDGKVQNLTMSYSFNVKLSENENPQVCPRVNMDGMPVKLLCQKAWEALKVSGRPSMKKLTSDQLQKNYHRKEISWRALVSQEAAAELVSLGSKTDDELDADIARLIQLKKARQTTAII